MMRRTTVLFILLAAALSLALFSLKYEVQDLEDEFTVLNRSILAERRAMHVLKAEWSYLNDPARLGALAARHLGLRPVESEQLGTLGTLSVLSSGREDAPKTNVADRNTLPLLTPLAGGRVIR
jgi:cell division protein FtsL